MIERSYLQSKSSEKRKLYRADKVSEENFKSMQDSLAQKKASITINGFISTSKNEKISLEYAAGKLGKGGKYVVIMYEITVDPTIPCSAHADIESISFHPREEEVLFNMGSTFQIDDIQDDPKEHDIKRIKLTAKDFNVTLLDEMKAKVKQSSQATLSILLVRYLIELGEDRISRRYLNQLIDSKQLDNDPNLVAAYNCLGTILSRQALHGEALKYYRKALNTQARLEFSNNNALAEIFNNIGQTHLGLNQLEEAQQNLEEGIRIQKREPKYLQQHLAALYCNLGEVAYAQREYDDAQTNFELAYDLFRRTTKISHDALEKSLLKADLCIAFGHLKSVQNPKDSTEANEKFEEALNIYECILPSSHPKVAETRIDIVCEYTRNRNFQAVITFYSDEFRAVLKDYELKPSTSQLDLAHLYANIGACFAHQKDFEKAMLAWQKSNEHEQKAFLDELLSSARVSKIHFQTQLVESAYRAAFEHYWPKKDESKEYVAILQAKMHNYDDVIETLRGQSSFLLAHVCLSRRKPNKSMIVYKRLLKLQGADQTLLIGIALGMLTTRAVTKEDEYIAELIQIEGELQKRRGDSEAARQRMIINDYLAEAYLLLKIYDKAVRHSKVSFELKQRFYSSVHPCVTRNYQLMAASYFQKEDYKNAVQYYEKAIEIQVENMSSRHPSILSNYFLMGDCYCRMDKMELANEFYEQAQGSNESEAEDEENTEQDVDAMLRMYTNLAEAYARQKDFTTARSHEQSMIDQSHENLPTFVVELIEEEGAESMPFDELHKTLKSRLGSENGTAFAQVLQNFVIIRLSLARALLTTNGQTDYEEDATYLYEQAIELQLKLVLFQTRNTESLANRYEELSNAYDQLYTSMKPTSQEYLNKALAETTRSDHQLTLEFRLGNLAFAEKEYTEADGYWKSALKKVKDTQIQMKKLIEKQIEKNKENLTSSEENTDDDDDNDEHDEDQNSDQGTGDIGDEEKEEQERPGAKRNVLQSAKSARPSSTKSVNDIQKLDELVQGYEDLNDYEGALKYLKRYISKLEETTKPTWTETELEGERLPIVKVYYSLLSEAIQTASANLIVTLEQSEWTTLLQAYMKLFTLAVRLPDEFDQMARAIVAVFHISQMFHNIPDHLVQLFRLLLVDDLDDLSWDQFFDRLSPTEYIHVFMSVADYHLGREEWVSALTIYCHLQSNMKVSGILQSTVNYGILKLLDKYVPDDAIYLENISAIDIWSPAIPTFDRIILCRLIIAFFVEIEDEDKSNEFHKLLLRLQKETWDDVHSKITDGIGQVLTGFEHGVLSALYWSELRGLYEETMPTSIVSRLFASDSTFGQIYREVQEMHNSLSDNLRSLADGYERLSGYEKNDDCISDACQSLKKAIVILKKIPSASEKMQQLQIKVNKMQDEYQVLLDDDWNGCDYSDVLSLFLIRVIWQE